MSCRFLTRGINSLLMPLPALFVLLLSLSAQAFAFEGRVVDQNGAPIAGAEVAVLGHAGSTRTDLSGQFVWTPDPAPPFEILILLPNGNYMAPSFVAEIPTGC